MEIITNNVPRPMLALYELPAKTQLDFDYVREEGSYSPRFVKYKGAWYDVDDTQAVRTGRGTPKLGMKDWDLFVSETFFSGVLFRLVDDDQVIVGRYFS